MTGTVATDSGWGPWAGGAERSFERADVDLPMVKVSMTSRGPQIQDWPLRAGTSEP